ncbi:MAG: hypothetical protein AUK48_02410 [Oscillatoriales cyanobacterium CG2_30_44_21]|nr:MAG: hypothetical protein AUK48_02410 [Oscillatoriales cyanobacterium CG2_30_44_21]
MAEIDIDGRIAQANGRLKSAKVGIAIARQGDRLYLRGTFPPKPDSDKKTALLPLNKWDIVLKFTPTCITTG